MNLKAVTIGALMVGMALTACQKNEIMVPTPKAEKEQTDTGSYSLKIKGFSTSSKPMKSGVQAKAVIPYLKQLSAVLFKDGMYVTGDFQKPMPNGEGNAVPINGAISFNNLAAGVYTLVVTGSNTYNLTTTNSSAFNVLYIHPTADRFSSNDPFYALMIGQRTATLASTDIFYKKLTFTLDGDTELDALNMERLTGQLDFDFSDLDSFPAGSYVSVTVSGLAQNYSPESEKFATNNKIDYFVWDPTIAYFYMGAGEERGYTVRINVNNAANQIISTKVVSDVRIYPNKRTVLEGPLMTADPLNPGASLQLSIKEELNKVEFSF